VTPGPEGMGPEGMGPEGMGPDGMKKAVDTTGAGERIRILLVDDHPLIRQGFRMILSAQPDLEVVGEAVDGADALRRVAQLAPDVVLMDVRMPGMDGIEATRQIRLGLAPGSPGSRVLILTTFGLDQYVVDALAAGASGFLLKDATPEELVHAVRVVAAGDALLSPAVTAQVIARLLPALGAPGSGGPTAAGAGPVGSGPSDSGGMLATLTEREREVLLLLARGQSNAEIGASLFISETTVKTHISHVLAKLGLRDRVQAVVAAYELGLLAPGGA
jgi:DNA-binding NarL/FixJ family response regulator